MPQTTIASPSAATQAIGASGLGVQWANPTNVLTDNGVNATIGGNQLNSPSYILTAANFGLLAGETGGVLAGARIPAGAAIVGIRFTWDVVTDANMSLPVTAPGAAMTVAKSTAQSLKTIGFGTLSVGSTVPSGDIWNGFDLTDTVQQQAARASLANGTMAMTAQGQGTNSLTNGNGGVDYMSVTVQWAFYADATGGGRANSAAAGLNSTSASRVAVQTANAAVEGGMAQASSGLNPDPVARVSIQTSKSQSEGGRSASTLGGALAKPATNSRGGATASESLSGGQGHPYAGSIGGGAGVVSEGGGDARVYSFSISGHVFNASGNLPIAGARCKIYRFSDDAVMGETVSDASGYYAVAIAAQGLSPLGHNIDETFWVRFWKSGFPNMFATTDDNLPLVVSQIQGPPES